MTKKITVTAALFFLGSLNLYAFEITSELPPVSEISGLGNNPEHPEWGTPGQQFIRRTPNAYGNGISTPSGMDRPSARIISNALAAQGEVVTHDERNMSAYAYTWGQFIDHDLDITHSSSPAEPFRIQVPRGDERFDPQKTGSKTINLHRSIYDRSTGTDPKNPRQQVNRITAFLDGSVLYGSDDERARALRTLSQGKMKTSPGGLLPLNNQKYFPVPLTNQNLARVVPDSELFVAGDIRANENVELTAVHTLFVREHNFWAEKIAKEIPDLNDEQIYQYARAIVRAEIQVITYNEWLPTLMGKKCLKPYRGYKPTVNPGIANEFATAALRIGHTLLASDIEFFDNDGNPVREGISLKEAFFNPTTINEVGIDPLIKYLATTNASKVDTLVVDDIRNFLFGLPGAGGLDLASLNIQRGRDHGLPDYNTGRAAYKLPRVRDFSDITRDADLQAKLKDLYGSVDNIDMWVGGLAESHDKYTSVGPYFTRILLDQFTRLRDGDRFWYENIFYGKQLKALRKTKFNDVIKRNTTITNIQPNVFIFDGSDDGQRYPRRKGMKNITIELSAR